MEPGKFTTNHDIALERLSTAVTDNGWFIQPDDSVALESFSDTHIGLESFVGVESEITQGPGMNAPVPFFNPVNISVQNGIYYVTIYVCAVDNSSILSQRLAQWFGLLRDTDHVKLSIASRMTNIPLACLTTILGAIANTKAIVEIVMDQIVIDGLAYFYLLAPRVCVRECGALFIPSYIENRSEDTSAPWRAVHDFYKWIVETAVTFGRLTHEEGERLNSGQHVVVPSNRFSNYI